MATAANRRPGGASGSRGARVRLARAGNPRHKGLRRRSNRLRKGAPWLKTTLVQCAWAAVKKKDSYLQAQFYRIKARRGPKKAIMAVEQAIGSTFAGIVLLIWITKGSSCTRDRSFCILGRLPSHIGLSLAPSHFLSFRQKERCGSNDECR